MKPGKRMSSERRDLCPQCGRQGIGAIIKGQHDGVLYWFCTDGERWHRHPQDDPLHEVARPYVERTAQ